MRRCAGEGSVLGARSNPGQPRREPRAGGVHVAASRFEVIEGIAELSFPLWRGERGERTFQQPAVARGSFHDALELTGGGVPAQGFRGLFELVLAGRHPLF